MKKLSLILLIIGILLSQVVRIVFNLNDGFEFQGIMIKFLPIFDYAAKGSNELYLTSTILGYIAFMIFGIINTNKVKSPEIFKSVFFFTIVTVVVAFFEFTAILEDILGKYEGKHFRIGWLLFLLGFWIFSKKYYSKNKA